MSIVQQHPLFFGGGLRKTSSPVTEFRNGGIAVESLTDATILTATGHLWPNALWRRGRNELVRELKGTRPSMVEVYRRGEGEESEWLALFVFLGDLDTFRRRRILFYNAELYIHPHEFAKTLRELKEMREERYQDAITRAASIERKVLTP